MAELLLGRPLFKAQSAIDLFVLVGARCATFVASEGVMKGGADGAGGGGKGDDTCACVPCFILAHFSCMYDKFCALETTRFGVCVA